MEYEEIQKSAMDELSSFPSKRRSSDLREITFLSFMDSTNPRLKMPEKNIP